MERETVQNTRAAREVIGGDRFAVLALNLIDRNPDQPRRQFDEEALAKLALSIEESGVIEPILVRPRQGRYELVAGERRWRAAHRAGLGEIPAVICELDDITAFLLAVTENTAREDLNPIEEARAFLRLVDRAGMSKAEIARRVGRTREAVANLVRLLELPDNALELIETGEAQRGTRARTAALQGPWGPPSSGHTGCPGALERARARDRARRQRVGLSARSQPRERLHPDQQATIEALGDLLGDAFGRNVAVHPCEDGYAITVTVANVAQARSMIDRATRADIAGPRDGLVD